MCMQSVAHLHDFLSQFEHCFNNNFYLPPTFFSCFGHAVAFYVQYLCINLHCVNLLYLLFL